MPNVSAAAREIFLSALERATPSERVDFLNQACQGDADLRQQVEALLRVHDEPDSLLDQQRINLRAPLDLAELSAITIDQPATNVGATIGPYKLVEQIGEGGMGLVFMAEQQRPVRRLVALKVVKPGMDSRQVFARFDAERQALAMMDHPNIARVLDASTTDTGHPYFVMELVRGIPLNEFCDQKRLTVRQRLELFIQVCQAVQHAHQKGVIHRDLKPTNVLVTMHDALAVPKVIDFGIAKALGQQLTDHTLITGFAQMIGTPLYMSPEQADMNQFGVDTRSDVYSLGVMLYELLTGTTPFDKQTLTKAGFDELRRIIRDEEPAKPSARVSTLEAQVLSTVSDRRSTDPRRISTTLRGELDWIVMKSLEKDRTRRYESPSALAADIHCYLNAEPVQACPPSWLYRWRTLGKKHRLAVASSAAVAAALIIGTALAIWQSVEANSARKLADERLILAGERLKNEQRSRNEADIQRVRAEAGEKTAAEQEAVANETNQFLVELLSQASVERQTADGFVGNRNLTVKEAVDRAATKLNNRFKDRPLVEASIRAAIAQSYLAVAEPESAVTHLRRALVLRRSELGAEHSLTISTAQLLAIACTNAGLMTEAFELHSQVLKAYKEKLGTNHALVVNCLHSYGRAHQKAGHLKLAESKFRACLEISERIGTPTANAKINLARNLLLQHKYEEAQPYAQEALEYWQANATSENWGRFVAMSLLGEALSGQGRFAESEPLLLEGYRGLKQAEPSLNASGQWRLAEAAQWLVQFYEATEQSDRANEWRTTWLKELPFEAKGTPLGAEEQAAGANPPANPSRAHRD